MAISFVGSQPTVAAQNGGNVTLTFSNLRDAANVQPTLLQNDVVFAVFGFANTADFAFPTITGWTLLGEVYANGSTNDTNLGVYYKRMGASPDASVTITGPGGAANASIGTAFALRGVSQSAVIDVYVAGTHNASGTGTGAINPAAITPSASGSWIFVCGALANPIGANLTNGGDLSATTNHFRTGTSPDTNDISIGVGLKIDWASGAFDPAAWSGGGTRAAGDSWAAMTFSVKEEPPAAQNLTPSVFTNSQAFHAPTVERGVVDVSPGLVTNTQTFPAAVVAAAVDTVEIAVIVGQSNAVGQNLDDGLEVDMANVYQYGGESSIPATYQLLTSDITPLHHPTASAIRIGPGNNLLAKLKTQNPSSVIIAVPAAKGATGMVSGGSWLSSLTPGSGGDRFEFMVNQANDAIADAAATWPSVPINVTVFFVQGEHDAGNAISKATYLAALTDWIAHTRARITGASNATVVLGSMIPRLWDPRSPNYSAAYAAINEAHVAASLNITGVRYSRGSTLSNGGESSDGLHYTPIAFARTQGDALGDTLSDVVGPTMTSPSTKSNTLATTLSHALTASDTFGHATFHIDGGAGAANFEISDPYISPTLRWTGNGTGPAAGAYVVGVRARDGAGNYGATQTITITVSAEVSPATFFTAGERGMVWDPNDISTLFQDVAGTIPVTAPGQPVGRMLDLSPNANHWTAAADNTTRPTYTVDGDGFGYLSFDGSNDVLFAATPFIQVSGNAKFFSAVGIFGAAQAAGSRSILGCHSTATTTPFVEPLAPSGTTTSVTQQYRNDASGGSSPAPPVLTTILDSTKRVVSSHYNGTNSTMRMREEGGSYQSATQGTTGTSFAVTRATLGARGFGTVTGFYAGRVYAGFVINRYPANDAEVLAGEAWASNRIFATSSDVTLTPGLFTNSNSFHASTVGRGTVDLTPGLISTGQTFHQPTVAPGAVNLASALKGTENSFSVPVVAAGAVNLSPSLVIHTNTFQAPNVTAGAYALTPGLYTSSVTFEAPTVSGGSATLAPMLVELGQTFQSPAVAPGGVELLPNLMANVSTFQAPTVLAVAALLPSPVGSGIGYFGPTVVSTYVLAPPLLSLGQSFPAPVVQATVNLAPSLVESGNIHYGPAITGLKVLLPTLAGSTISFSSPAVLSTAGLTSSLYTPGQIFPVPVVSALAAIQPSLFGPTLTIHSPLVSTGLALAPNFVSFGQAFYTPIVAGDSPSQNIIPNLFTNVNSVFSPAIGAQNALEPALFGPNLAIFTPVLSSLYSVLAPFMGSSGQVFAPEVGVSNQLLPLQIGSQITVFLPQVASDQALEVDKFTNTQVFYVPFVSNLLGGGYVAVGVARSRGSGIGLATARGGVPIARLRMTIGRASQ
jgi:hypothetical protein